MGRKEGRMVTGVMAAVPSFVVHEMALLDPETRKIEFRKVGVLLDLESQARSIKIGAKSQARKADRQLASAELAEVYVCIGNKYGEAATKAREYYGESRLPIYLIFAAQDSLSQIERYGDSLHEAGLQKSSLAGPEVADTFSQLMNTAEKAIQDAESVALSFLEREQREDAAKAYGKAGTLVEVMFDACRILERKVQYTWSVLADPLTRAAENHKRAAVLFAELNKPRDAVREYDEAGDIYEEAAELLSYYDVDLGKVLDLMDQAIQSVQDAEVIMEKLAKDSELGLLSHRSYLKKLIQYCQEAADYAQSSEIDPEMEPVAAAGIADRSAGYLNRVARIYLQLYDDQNAQRAATAILDCWNRAAEYFVKANRPNEALNFCRKITRAEVAEEDEDKVDTLAHKKIGLLCLIEAHRLRQRNARTPQKRIQNLTIAADLNQHAQEQFLVSGEMAGIPSMIKNRIEIVSELTAELGKINDGERLTQTAQQLIEMKTGEAFSKD